MATVYSTERDTRTKRTTTLSVALGLVTALQAVTMFFSLRGMMPSGGIEQIIIPALAGIVIGVAFWLVWHWLGRVGPLTQRPLTRVFYIGIAIVLTMVAIGTTSWFIATGIGGSVAMRVHMNSYLTETSKRIATLSSNSASEYTLRGMLGEIAGGWRGAAEMEARGTYTGTAGKGPMVDKLNAAAESYQRLAETLETSNAEFKAAKTKATHMMADLTKIANGDGDQQRFLAGAAQLNELLSAMDSITVLPQLQTRGGLIDIKLNNSELSTKLEKNTQRLRDAAKTVADERKPVEPVVYQPTERATATLTYASSVPGAWVIGVGFDVLPLIIFLMLVVAYHDAQAGDYRPRRAFAVIEGDRDVA